MGRNFHSTPINKLQWAGGGGGGGIEYVFVEEGAGNSSTLCQVN